MQVKGVVNTYIFVNVYFEHHIHNPYVVGYGLFFVSRSSPDYSSRNVLRQSFVRQFSSRELLCQLERVNSSSR